MRTHKLSYYDYILVYKGPSDEPHFLIKSQDLCPPTCMTNLGEVSWVLKLGTPLT